jgi:GNAT superfamily N-acetyltransferase
MLKSYNWQIALLSNNHDKSYFSCGVGALDDYIKKLASQDMKRHVSNVFVATHVDDSRIYGYYTLSAHAIDLENLPDKVKRKLPRYRSVPATLLGRLAVDQTVQGQGLGAHLLASAIRRVINSELAWAVFIIKAKDQNAAAFYQKFGFLPFESAPQLLWASRDELNAIYLK